MRPNTVLELPNFAVVFESEDRDIPTDARSFQIPAWKLEQESAQPVADPTDRMGAILNL
jgi:hypothetical protein